MPDDRDANDDRIAEQIIDLLLVVVKRHGLERKLFAHARRLDNLTTRSIFILGKIIERFLAGAFYRRIDRAAKRIDKKNALTLERTDVLAEQRQYERLIRPQHLDAARQQPTRHRQIYDAHNQHSSRHASHFIQIDRAQYDQRDRCDA